MAIERGTNLKNYIEGVLADIADNYEDAESMPNWPRNVPKDKPYSMGRGRLT